MHALRVTNVDDYERANDLNMFINDLLLRDPLFASPCGAVCYVKLYFVSTTIIAL